MIGETVDLYAYFKLARGENTGGYLSVCARNKNVEIGEKLRPVALVVPGGAYLYVSEREGEPVAMKMLAEGYVAATLRYTVRAAYPVPLLEAAMAIAYLRAEAERYCADKSHVAAFGFSAGGHLVGMLGTLFGEACVKKVVGENARPDAVVLGYPVVTLGEWSHGGTAGVITGGDPALYEALTLEKRVRADSSPAFLWHTVEDTAVPVENSLLMAQAYRRAGVPFELHLYEGGQHGLSVSDLETAEDKEDPRYRPETQSWVPLVLSWLRSRGFEVRKK